HVQDLARAAFDGSGRFVIVWQSDGEDGSGYGVSAQRFDAAWSRVGPEFGVNTYTSSSQRNASVAMNRTTGDFLVVWESTGQPSGSDILGQRYAASGAPQDVEFRINSTTTSSQVTPSVAADGSGNFFVVWAQTAQGTVQSGVFAQRFDGAGGLIGGEFRI